MNIDGYYPRYMCGRTSPIYIYFSPLGDRIGVENKIYPTRSRYYIGWEQITGDIPIIVAIDNSVDITINITVYITTSDI